MYTIDHIFPVLPIKDIINKGGKPTTPYKLATSKKTSVSYLHVLFFPCVIWKATSHVDNKLLNMRHQAQRGFCGIFVGIPQHQKVYRVYVPSTRKIVSSYDVFVDEKKASTLAYKSQPYSEVKAMRPAVSYIPVATYLRLRLAI